MWPFKRKQKSTQDDVRTDIVFDAPLAPDEPLAVIGDVHGCLPHLNKMLDQLASTAPEARIVTVGDYVDRGEDSSGVLTRLAALSVEGRVTCLKGNHEDMVLGFLDDPATVGSQWLRFGGLQSLASYGVGGVTETSGPAQMIAARDALRAAMGPEIEAWLRALPLLHQSGNVAVVHAAASPRRPLQTQTSKAMLWGHPLFAREDRSDGIWIAHGHTIAPEVEAHRGRIATDTGAYATGVLSAALIYPDGAFESLSTRG